MAEYDTLNLGHRGASAYAPENTMAAFAMALEMGADGLELDVQLTSDGHIVVFHDDKLNRTSNMTGHLYKHTLEQLRTADMGGWYAPEFSGERIPLLHDVIDLVQGRGVLDIEIKVRHHDDLGIVHSLLDLLNKRQFEDVVLTSFFHPAVEAVKDFAPHIPVGLLTLRTLPPEITGREMEYICPHEPLLTPETVEDLHSRGLKILTWTVNEESRMQELLDMQVAGIITNAPDVLKSFKKYQKLQKSS